MTAATPRFIALFASPLLGDARPSGVGLSVVVALVACLGFGPSAAFAQAAEAESRQAWAAMEPRVASPDSIRIGVAPFEGELSDGGALAWNVSSALHGELVARSLQRVLPPGSFVADRAFAPDAASVREWAYNAAVDHVVFGRIIEPEVDAEVGAVAAPVVLPRIEIVLHSGHSGAELSRHSVRVSDRSQLGALVDQLAVSILSDLGVRGVELSRDAVATAEAGEAVAAEEERGGGIDTRLDLPGFQNDAPIEIKADEAEIVSRGDGRELVFQRNVFVRQANVTLRSDRLAASYRKGESEPRKLVAEGQVHVDQGDRSAKCDEAIYERELQKLICRGHAELVQGCDIVRGDSIQFDLAFDRARVEGAASIVIRPKADESAAAACNAARGLL